MQVADKKRPSRTGRNVDIHLAGDYIIRAVRQSGDTLTVLKLQKLLYYAQAWHLALEGEPFFAGKFQAWPQGPVNREIYDRFIDSKSLDSELLESDISKDFSADRLNEEKRMHLDRVLRRYGKYDDSVLQEMIAREAPWREARGRDSQRCEREIDEDNMKRFCMVLYLVGLQGGVSPGASGVPPRKAAQLDTLPSQTVGARSGRGKTAS